MNFTNMKLSQVSLFEVLRKDAHIDSGRLENFSATRSLQCRHGLSLLECSISVLLVGVLLVSALQTLGAAKRRESDTVRLISGRQLACDLMNEILLQSYEEPLTAVAFGPEPDEGGGNRSLYDDVDDYHSLSESPPKDRSGNTITGFEGWTQTVVVQWADPTTWNETSGINTGLKRISIAVLYDGKKVDSTVGYRSEAWSDSVPSPYDATGNHPPVALASSNILVAQVGQTINFSAEGSSDPDGDFLSYVWNFGDGSTGSGLNITKSYNQSGSFACTLTVYDGQGSLATATLVLEISLSQTSLPAK